MSGLCPYLWEADGLTNNITMLEDPLTGGKLLIGRGEPLWVTLPMQWWYMVDTSSLPRGIGLHPVEAASYITLSICVHVCWCITGTVIEFYYCTHIFTTICHWVHNCLHSYLSRNSIKFITVYFWVNLHRICMHNIQSRIITLWLKLSLGYKGTEYFSMSHETLMHLAVQPQAIFSIYLFCFDNYSI